MTNTGDTELGNTHKTKDNLVGQSKKAGRNIKTQRVM